MSTPARPRDTILDPDKIVATVETLERRIADRFADSGLRKVCRQLLQIARLAQKRSIAISRPILPLRVTTAVLMVLFLAAPIIALFILPDPERRMT